MRCESNHHDSGFCPSQHIASDGCYCDCHSYDEDAETEDEGDPIPNSAFIPATTPTNADGIETWELNDRTSVIAQDLAGNWYLLQRITRDQDQRVRLYGKQVDVNGTPRKGARLVECLRDEA